MLFYSAICGLLLRYLCLFTLLSMLFYYGKEYPLLHEKMCITKKLSFIVFAVIFNNLHKWLSNSFL